MSEIATNPKVLRKKIHHRKIFWQVWLPLVFSTMIITAIAVLVVILTFNPSFGDFHTKWSSVSLVLLSVPALLIALLGAALLFALVYLIGKLYAILPDYFHKALDFVQLINSYLKLVSDRVASPFIYTNSMLAGLKSISKEKGKTNERSRNEAKDAD